MNSVSLPFFFIQVVDYMVWDIFAGGIENHIYQLLYPLSNTLLNDTTPITYNSSNNVSGVFTRCIIFFFFFYIED